MNYRDALNPQGPGSTRPPAKVPEPRTALKSQAFADDKQPSDDDKDNTQTLPDRVRAFFAQGYLMPPPSQGGTSSNGNPGSSPLNNSQDCPAYGFNPERQAPPGVVDAINKGKIIPGDVIFFAGSGSSTQGHAEMYCGKGPDGHLRFASDADQGDHFFANADFTHGQYAIYRDMDPNYSATRAVQNIERDSANHGYGGECAHEVMNSVQAGGANIGPRHATASGYVGTGMNNSMLVGSGGPEGFQLSPALASGKPSPSRAPTV